MGAAGSGTGECPAVLGPSPGSSSRTTATALPVVRYEREGVAVGPTRARVAGFVPGARPVALLAEYGRGSRYGSCSTWQKVTSGRTVRITIKGLHPADTYHVRLVARTAAGTVAGADRTFRTLAAGHVPQGVEIGSVPVGGLSRDAALRRLTRPLAAPLRLSYAGAFWHVAAAKAGARVGATRAIASALVASPGESLPRASISVDPTRLRAYVAALSRRWGRRPHPASVVLVGRRAVVRPAVKSLQVDEKRMESLIANEIRTGSRQLLTLAVEKGAVAPADPQKAVVVRLGAQTLTAYLNGKPVLTTPVTTGRSALPTPVGSYSIKFRASPFVFNSPWPPGNPFWYPPTPVTWAMDFYGGDFLHDDPGEPPSAFGAGSEYGPYASHGCVHVPHDSMAFLYDWLPIGAPVIVAQS